MGFVYVFENKLLLYSRVIIGNIFVCLYYINICTYLDYKWNSDLKIQSNLCKILCIYWRRYHFASLIIKTFFCYIRFFKNKFIHTISLFFTKKVFPPQNSSINVFVSLCNIKRDISEKHFLRIIIIHSRNNTSYYSTLKYYKILLTS